MATIHGDWKCVVLVFVRRINSTFLRNPYNTWKEAWKGMEMVSCHPFESLMFNVSVIFKLAILRFMESSISFFYKYIIFKDICVI